MSFHCDKATRVHIARATNGDLSARLSFPTYKTLQPRSFLLPSHLKCRLDSKNVKIRVENLLKACFEAQHLLLLEKSTTYLHVGKKTIDVNGTAFELSLMLMLILSDEKICAANVRSFMNQPYQYTIPYLQLYPSLCPSAFLIPVREPAMGVLLHNFSFEYGSHEH